MSTATTTTPVTTLGIFASIKHVIITLCSSIVKATTVLDTSLDISQDIMDSGRILSIQLKEETKLQAENEILQLEADIASSK